MKTCIDWTKAELNGYDDEITSDNYIELDAISFRNLVKEIQIDCIKHAAQVANKYMCDSKSAIQDQAVSEAIENIIIDINQTF